MNTAETEFLALVALGMFTVDTAGRVWRHKEWTRGSHNGSDPALVPTALRRADVSTSGKRHPGSTSYLRVAFVAKGTRRQVAAPRVVWMLKNGEPIPRGLEINHKNGNGKDNRPENLEVVTTSQNATHAIHVLGASRKGRRGSANEQAKINESQAAEIRRLAARKSMPQWQIAKMFGVGQQTVSNIATGKTWRHVSIS